MLNLKQYRNSAKSFADLLNYAVMVDEGVMLTKDGSFLAAASFAGPDLASYTEADKDALTVQFNNAVMKLDSGWSMHVDCVRHQCTEYPESEFPDAVTQMIDEERKERYQSFGSQFENDYVIALCFTPPEGSDKSALFGSESDSKKSSMDINLATFKSTAEDFFRVAGGGGMISVEPFNTTQLVQYVYRCITGEVSKVQLPVIPAYLDVIFGCRDFVGGISPKLGDQHLRCITINGFPPVSHTGILETLAQAPLNYRWNTRFIALGNAEGVAQLQNYRKTWFGKRKGIKQQAQESSGGDTSNQFEDGDSVAMALDADLAVQTASSGEVRFGYYTSTVVLRHEDEALVDEWARDIQKTIENTIGFSCMVESINAVEAFLGSLPSHKVQNVRKPLMQSANLADLLPLGNVFAGEGVHPCPFYPAGSPALIHAVTNGSTPFRLNLHVNDLGHTMILGPTGSGKSTILGLLMAQQFRYPDAQVFCFDKGYSAKVLCDAKGGKHYDILGEGTDGLSFAPLATLSTAQDLAWASDWVEGLLVLQGMDVGVSERKMIFDAVKLLAQSDDRTLQALQAKLPTQVLQRALDPYVIDGKLGILLDSAVDSVKENPFQVFELEHLMNLGGDKAAAFVVPVLLYLFRAVEKRLKGQPTLIVLDEAWLLLDHPLFQAKIREWLKVLRKANAAVVFATQSISDVMQSDIKDVILESCPTKILLPNRQAKSDVAFDMYRNMGLNAAEIRIISLATPKQDYYYTSSLGKRLISFGMGPLTLAFIGASGKKDLALLEELKAKHGENWVEAWLKAKGLSQWAKRYTQITQQSKAEIV